MIYGVGLILVLIDLADGRPFMADVDDQMRELQIRYLMSAYGNWYDLRLPFVSMPDVYTSPWSRLVDLPYVAVAKMLMPFVSPQRAVGLAFHIWPPLMLAIFSLLAASIVQRLMVGFELRKLSYQISLAIMTFAMTMAVLEFAPGRIDHHNAQIITMLMVIDGLARWDRRGGMMIGAGSALSVVIGLECLPFVVVAYGGLVLCYIQGARGVRELLIAASVSMVAVTAFSALAFIGPGGIVSTQCDAFSAPYIALMCGFSLILGLCAAIQWATLLRRAIVLTFLSVALLVTAGMLFPSCLAGPYSIIDPLSRELWFDRIWQEHSFLYFYGNGQYDVLVLLALLTAATILAFPIALAKVQAREPGLAIIYGVALSSILVTLLLTRYIRFPAAFLSLFLPPTIAWLIDRHRFPRARRLAASCAAAGGVGFGVLYFVIPPRNWNFDAVDYMAFSECKGQDFSVFLKVPPGRIAVPQGLSLPVLFAAPPGFSVGAVPFHRSSPGMRRMFEAFRSSDAEVRRSALAPFDYVAVCRFPLKADPKDAPLYAALAAGKSWPGLQRIEPPAKTDFQLFSIDHLKLQ
ncbi:MULTISPECIES: hypothetical protein [unclassified Sinorhizobium]|uniref:hypothetical protein n=1 Tax=unclassified Sinorhizobium TaxID=2613772 RepID=UPI003526A175